MNFATLQLKPLDNLSGLEISSNSADFHHDLMVYLDYVGSHSVKRSQRDNQLSKNDARELTKRMSKVSPALEEFREWKDEWLAMVEFTAWRMALVSFNIESEDFLDFLRGSPGERENYITVNQVNAKKFLSLSPAQQEEKIRSALVEMRFDQYNELFDPSPVGRLDKFGYYMRNSSTAAYADFKGARSLLLSLLASLPGGVWYRVDDLVNYLKANHANFLLPSKIDKKSARGITSRYTGFSESTHSGTWSAQEIKDSDADSFERVEGRFIERFFEGLPLLLRYVEVAYETNPYQGPFPTRKQLCAFRVNDRYLHLAHGLTPAPMVTVQPNFEVTIISEVYPSDLTQQFQSLGKMVSQSTGQAGPSVIVFRLMKDRVAARVAAQPDLDVVQLLRKISGQELAQNLVTELNEWSAHSETFTVYDGFHLLETVSSLPPDVTGHLVKAQITPHLFLINDQEKIPALMSQAGEIVLLVKHADHEIHSLDDATQTVFATRSRPLKLKPQIQTVPVKREEKVILRFNGQREAFDALRSALAELRVPVETIDRELTILYPKAYEPKLDEALAAINDRFNIQIT